MENFLSEIHSLFEDRVLLEQVIGYDTEDLTKMIINQRKNNLRNYAENSKNFLINKGRCPICTLIIPCKHYQLNFHLFCNCCLRPTNKNERK